MSPSATRVWAEIARVPNPIIFGGFRNTDEVRTAGALHLHQIGVVWSNGRIRLNLVSRIGSFGITGELHGPPSAAAERSHAHPPHPSSTEEERPGER